MLQRLHNSARYHLFILTAWEEGRSTQGSARWRYSLEQSQTGERKGFKNLEELMAYLATWTQQPPRVDEFGEPDSGQYMDGQGVDDATLAPPLPIYPGDRAARLWVGK